MFESLYNTVALKFFIKKKLNQRYFPVNTAKFLKSAFVTEHRRLLSTWSYHILWLINEQSRSHHVLCRKRVSIITDLLLRIIRYKEKIIKMSLTDFFVVAVLESVYYTCCCSITNTVISLVAHKLHQIRVNNHVKSTQSKLTKNIIVFH